MTDRAAGTVVDASLARAGGVLHLSNARCADLGDVMRAMADTLGLPLVAPVTWMRALAALADGHASPGAAEYESGHDEDTSQYAATRLRPFLQHVVVDHGLPRLTPHRTLTISRTLAETQPIDSHDVVRWVACWRSCAFIS